MTETTARPKAKRGAFTAYVALWLVLAGLALGYLVLLSMHPSMLAGLAGAKGSEEDSEHALTQQSIADLSSEIQTLQASLGEMRREIGDVRSEIGARVERENELNLRLAALESSAAAAAEALAAQQAAAKGGDGAAATKVGTKDAKKEAAKTAADAKKAAPKGTAAAAAQAAAAPASAKPAPTTPPAAPPGPAAGTTLETGSLDGGGVSPFGPPVVTPAKRPIGLSLGSAPSVDSLRLNWSVLADQNADALQSLRPHYVTGVSGSDLTYELIAGPVSSAAEAKRICGELIQRGNSCRVGELAGSAL